MNFIKNHWISIAVAVIFFIGIFLYSGAHFFLEWWWFDTLSLGGYFILRESYRVMIVLVVTLIFWAIIYFNLAYIPKLIKTESMDQNFSDPGDENSKHKKKSVDYRMIMFLSVLITIPVLIPVYLNWESFLLYFFSAASDLKDPVYSRDIGYYLFSFPVYLLIQIELVMVFSLLFCIAAFKYWRFYKKTGHNDVPFPVGGRIHLTALIVTIVLLEAWSISFARTELLYVSRHEPVFFGPGLVEMTYELPLIWLTFFTFLGAAFLGIYYLYKKTGLKLALGFLAAFLLLTGFRQISFIPGLIDRFYVKPNPVTAEKKYIQYNIDATLDAFGLSHVEKIDYPVYSSLTPDVSTEIYQELFNIPVWDHDLLDRVYDQLQAIRPFYNFTPVTVDRYHLGGMEQQVNIAARELNLDKLPPEARNWENTYLRYTHGFGAVVTPASQKADRPMQWYLHELTLKTEFEKLKITQPDIYYGLENYKYAIVPNNAPKAPMVGNDVNADYAGTGGLRVSSLLMKLVFSAFMKDEKIFFSRSITNNSKLLIRRNIIKRIKSIAPFLKLDSNPYPVIVDQKIFWIIDAYTVSDLYPVVKPVVSPFMEKDPEDEETLNFIRNSVKIIVDAYNGSVFFYIVDPKDPVAAAYSNAYPTLFKKLSDIPQGFFRHLSYPQNLFHLQMEIYTRYHQTNPQVYYQQSDAMKLAQMEGQDVLPYYLTVDILDKPGRVETETERFILVSPLSPIGRKNLGAIAIAGCLDIEDCNKQYAANIYFYDFSEKVQVDGPEQVSALIAQNPDISRYFSLWDQRGSRLIKGRMIIMPVERSILYIQPIYLVASNKTGFPQLVRVIVSMNQETAMGESIKSAYQQLEQKLNVRITR